MAQHGGISSIPFEQRYRPPDPKRRRRERLTAGDRLVCGVFGSLMGLLFWTFGYFIVITVLLKLAAKAHGAGGLVDPLEHLPYFGGGVPVVLGFAVFGAVVGPELMMDTSEKVLRVENEIADYVSRG